MSVDGGSFENGQSAAPIPSATEGNLHVDPDFNKLLAENPGEAWHMATSNLEPESQRSSDNPWVGREGQAFEAFAKRMFITAVPKDPDERLRHQTEAEALFGSARFREDGLNSDHPSVGSRLVAEAMIRTDLAIPGREGFAVQTAEMAHFPEKRIQEVRTEAARIKTTEARAQLGTKISEHPIARAVSSAAKAERAFEHLYLQGAREMLKVPGKVMRRITSGPTGSSIGRR